MRQRIIERFDRNGDNRQYLILKKEQVPYSCKTYRGDVLCACSCTKDPHRRRRDCLDCNNSGWTNFGWDTGIPHLYWLEVKDEVRYETVNKLSWTKDIKKASLIDLDVERGLWSNLLTSQRSLGFNAWNFSKMDANHEYV